MRGMLKIQNTEDVSERLSLCNVGMTRRAFLRGAASAALVGAGGCAGMSAVGPLRKDDTLIAILADCHVGNWRSPKYQGVKFAECIARVLALDPLPAWQAIVSDNAGKRCTFVSRQIQGC